MKVKDEAVHKVYVDPEGLAVIKCPVCSCEKSTRVDSSVIREKNLRKNCVVRCTCKKKFSVKLEFRRDFRKNSDISGEYLSLPSGNPRGRMKVVNISRHGIGLQIDDSSRFKIGDEILILFSLDETEDSLIEKRAEIRVAKQDYIGCEFLASSTLGKALGSYLEAPEGEEKPADDDDDEQFDWSTVLRR